MRVVIQRVQYANVTIEDNLKASIGNGLLVLAGFEEADEEKDLQWMSAKIAALRIFADDAGLMNKSVVDVDGEVLIVSQFTLHASCKKGNRPSFIKAAKPPVAIPLYQKFVSMLQSLILKPIQTGTFGADMKVGLLNNGPVTIIIDSKNPE